MTYDEDAFDGEKFPFPLSDIDKQQLSITDAEYHPHTWEELKQIVDDNRLEVLKRWPSDLKRYIKWSNEVRAQYGGVLNYVMEKRLEWVPSARSTPSTGPLFDCRNAVPFADKDDYKILPNDWPYGLDRGIYHLIVWLKNRLEIEPLQGDMTPKARSQVEDFVQATFTRPAQGSPGSEDKIIWFKNWGILQSVRGIDHIHILVRNVPNSIIQEWTEGEKMVQG